MLNDFFFFFIVYDLSVNCKNLNITFNPLNVVRFVHETN